MKAAASSVFSCAGSTVFDWERRRYSYGFGNSIIYLLLGPVFGIFIMRTTTITQFSFFATTALDNIDNILDYQDLSYGEKLTLRKDWNLNVSFSYKDEKVLDNISFCVKKGETVALVGPSGGGKSNYSKACRKVF